MLKRDRSIKIFDEAKLHTPGGINTAIRALDPPIVFTKASGSRIYDADGNEYIDYHMAFGPPILGHCNPKVNKKIFETLEEIDLIGVGTTELEAKVADKIVEHIPSAEQALLCIAGSEATYHAVRLSRAVTGRRKMIKFQGCYHGWHDYLCMNIISPPEKIGSYDPASAGMLKEAVENTIVLKYNDLDGVERAVRDNRGEVAGIILEPIQHNIGCVIGKDSFLKGLREICDIEDIILTFDEVITGFRHSIGGYQKICGVKPDLTTLGKSIANGYPCAAICGRKDLMERFATAGGDVFFAGTYNAHPISTAASLATIEELEDGRVYEHIYRLGEKIRRGLKEIVEDSGLNASVAGFRSVFVTYFMEPPIESYTDLLRNDSKMFVSYREKMIEHGVFMLPLNLKRNHISASHSDEDIKKTLEVAENVVKELVTVKAAE